MRGSKATIKYWGVTLLIVLKELLYRIINIRLTTKGQAGLSHGPGWVDYMLTLNSIVQGRKWLGEPIFCFFFDIDTEYKTGEMDSRTDFGNKVHAIWYSLLLRCVQLTKQETKILHTDQGVSQGRPILKIFVKKLSDNVLRCGLGVKEGDTRKPQLIFTDNYEGMDKIAGKLQEPLAGHGGECEYKLFGDVKHRT